jgi:hypothetical protein
MVLNTWMGEIHESRLVILTIKIEAVNGKAVVAVRLQVVSFPLLGLVVSCEHLHLVPGIN